MIHLKNWDWSNSYHSGIEDTLKRMGIDSSEFILVMFDHVCFDDSHFIKEAYEKGKIEALVIAMAYVVRKISK